MRRVGTDGRGGAIPATEHGSRGTVPGQVLCPCADARRRTGRATAAGAAGGGHPTRQGDVCRGEAGRCAVIGSVGGASHDVEDRVGDEFGSFEVDVVAAVLGDH
jgi:hypothetical protein